MAAALLINDTRAEGHHGCDAVCDNLVALFKTSNITFKRSVPVAVQLTESQLFGTLRDIDLVIINGEGTIHHERFFARHLLELGVWAKRKGRRVFLINATWDSNTADMARSATAFDGIFVRDSMSRKQLNEHHVVSNVVPDLSFLTTVPEFSGGRTGIAVFDSVRGDVAGTLDTLAKKLRGERISIYHKKSVSSAFTSMNISGTPLTYWIRAALSTFVRKDEYKMIARRDAFLAAMSTHRFVLTGRFHAMCFSIMMGIPFLAIQSNSNKMSALIEDIGLESDRVQPATSSELRLIKLIERFSEYSERERISIRTYIDKAQQSAMRMSLDISTTVHL